jgi:hypothetical protein
MNKLILAFFILLFTSKADCQQKDFVLLNGVKFEHKWNKYWSSSLALQTMLNENSSELWIAFADLGVTYRLSKHIETQLHVRQMKLRRIDNSYERRQLFYHTISWSKNISKLSYTLRHRTQQLTFEDHFDDAFKGPFYYFRDRFTIKYKINYYLQPYIATEFFFPLNRPNRPVMDQYRPTIGMFYCFNNKVKTEAYFLLQNPYLRQNATKRYVLGVNLYMNI